MNQSESSSQTEVSELKALVSKLLGKVDRLTAENAKLRDEIRHLKKLKGQPKIRPNKKEPEESASTAESANTASASNNTPPKSKRPRKSDNGRTARPSPTATDEICRVDGVKPGWRRKGYQDVTQVDVNMQFTAVRYRREVWLTPEGKTVIAPLPDHVKGHFGDNLKALVLDLYHSCSVTQPLLLDWLHSHDCSISEGSLNNLLIQNNDLFHQEKDEVLETGIASACVLQVDDTGARHDGKNGYCTVIGNETFTVFGSTSSKSRVNFLTLLQGQRRCYVLNETAITYMIQVEMSAKWIEMFSEYGECHFLSEAAWQAFLDDHKMSSKEQRRYATEAVLKGGLLNQGFPKTMIIHSDGARQFDTVFAHSLCWFHAGRPLAKLIPGNDLERAARDWIENQFWLLYDDVEAYSQSPTGEQKCQIKQDFDNWVTTQVDYQELKAVLGQLQRAREELLLILDHPWLPLHNNLSERQIREYVKRRKISGGTRSTLGQCCRDTFTSLKKTCRLHGVSFSRYLRDRISGIGKIPRLSELVQEKAAQLAGSFAYEI